MKEALLMSLPLQYKPSALEKTDLSVKRPDQSEGFRTRHGRLVKPLNRLIQTMSNQFVKNLFGENKVIP